MFLVECNPDFWEAWLDTFARPSTSAEDYWFTYCMGGEL